MRLPAFFLLAVLASFHTTPARAEQLSLLHVRHFAMQADRAQVRVGESFHVRISLQVDETSAPCNDVALPALYGFDELGDERRAYTRPTGTECTTILTLSPTLPGSQTIAPATLEAIDPDTAMPSRFSTNTVTIQVLHAPLATSTIIRNTLLQMLKVLVIVIVTGAVLWAGYWVLRRTLPGFGQVQRMNAPEQAFDKAAPMAPFDELERWRSVITHLRAEPTRGNVIAVRMILRDRVRARDDEVFGELLARINSVTDPLLLDAMRAIERAAFIDEANLPNAVLEAVRALERLTDKPPVLS